MAYAKTTTITAGATGDGSVLTLTTAAARQNKLIVIDWVVFSSTAGASSETWALSIGTAGAGLNHVDLLTDVAAGTSATVFLQFTSGLPMYLMDAGGVSTPNTTASVAVSMGGQVSASGTMQVGYHYEAPAQRPALH